MKRICVYIGSYPGDRPDYLTAVQELARELVSRNWALVYGGSKMGLMGEMANAVLALGGHVTGVIPHDLVDRELVHPHLSELRAVDSMHERKAQMAHLSSGFVALPGGLGTIEELFELDPQVF